MSIESFRHVYDDWKKSGLTIASYSEKIGMNKKKFEYWQAALRREEAKKGKGTFIPVSLTGGVGTKASETRFEAPHEEACNTPGEAPDQSWQLRCEITYRNGVVVNLTSDITFRQYRQMITLFD